MKRERTSKILNTVWVTACAIIFLMPLLWMLSSSLKTGPEVFAKDFTWLPKVFQWENYVRVWTDSKVPFWKLYVNSLTVSVVGTLGQLLISSLAGYALAKLRFRGKNFVFLLMMITMMIPGQATIIPRYMMFFSVGLYDTLWALILPSFFSISSIFLLRQFYLGLPNDLMEAARVDGATTWKTYWSIVFPIMKPMHATVAVLTAMSTWNDVMTPLVIMSGTGKNTLPLAQLNFQTQFGTNYNLAFASYLLALIPILLFYLVCQKQILNGVVNGAVK